MKFHLLTVWLLLILVISISLNSALATDFVIEIDDALAPVSLETLDSRNKDLQANTTLDGHTKA